MPEITLEDVNKSAENAMKAFEALKTDILPLKKDFENLSGEHKGQFAKMEKAIADGIEASQKEAGARKALEDQTKVQAEQIKALETAMNRPGAAQSDLDGKELKAKFRKAVNEFARENTGQSRGSQLYFDDFINEKYKGDAELKALSVGTDPNGGYTVMPEMGGIIQTKVYESSPMRQLAKVQPISTLSYEHVIDNDEVSSGWTGETSTRSETNTPVLGKITVTAHEVYAKPKATQTILDDSMIDMEAWLAGKIGEKFGRDEATAFVTGSGIAKPRGIMAYTAGTDITAEQIEQVVTGDASNFTYNGLVDLQNALKEPYQRNASFLFRRATNANLLKIKDGEGRPIFNMTYDKNAGVAASLLGQPSYFAADVAAIASNALAMAYGDFNQAYLIVDRIGMRLLRDPYSSKPYIEFYATKRVGGQVINFEAIKIAKIST